MKTSKLLLALAGLLAALALPGHAQAPAAPSAPAAAAPEPVLISDPGIVRSAIDLVRADIKTEKAVIIAENLALTADESAEFWPVYNDYHDALNQLLDERLVLLKEYVAIHEHMTDAQATDLAAKLFDLETKRIELKRTWFKKFTEAASAKRAAQFFQIENQVNAALDLLLMDSLPLIK
jgi:hypothetical protein